MGRTQPICEICKKPTQKQRTTIDKDVFGKRPRDKAVAISDVYIEAGLNPSTKEVIDFTQVYWFYQVAYKLSSI